MFGPFSYRYIDSKQMLICKKPLGSAFARRLSLFFAKTRSLSGLNCLKFKIHVCAGEK